MKQFYKMLVCALVLLVLPLAAGAENLTGTCGEGISWTLEEGTLTVSGNGPMEDFGEGGAPWQGSKDAITKVVLSGNVTTVGAYAFQDCDNITEVDFGTALHTLGEHSFEYCDGLTSIHLPSTFRIFGENCLHSCKNLTAIHCEGPFPSFKLNCLWDTNTKIYFPAKSPWPVTLIQQLEEAFHGRIEFLDSEGKDPYTPEEETTEATTEATTEPTTEATTEPTTEPTTIPTTAPTTVPTTAPTTAPATEAATEATTFPYTFPTEVTEAPKKSGGAGVGLALIGLTLSLAGFGFLIFGRKTGKKRGGKYSR